MKGLRSVSALSKEKNAVTITRSIPQANALKTYPLTLNLLNQILTMTLRVGWHLIRDPSAFPWGRIISHGQLYAFNSFYF